MQYGTLAQRRKATAALRVRVSVDFPAHFSKLTRSCSAAQHQALQQPTCHRQRDLRFERKSEDAETRQKSPEKAAKHVSSLEQTFSSSRPDKSVGTHRTTPGDDLRPGMKQAQTRISSAKRGEPAVGDRSPDPTILILFSARDPALSVDSGRCGFLPRAESEISSASDDGDLPLLAPLAQRTATEKQDRPNQHGAHRGGDQLHAHEGAERFIDWPSA